ncbi:GntR family transcriptional regulator [Paenibacillus thalictri]|uniref:GntR family transcriptional regulator n=1 Tax=Paenibacillus thalictri TaxID=2527873 RepID=A0A4Q9DLH1_9BACL|nr:GntR family transcriptional regulator [Paenibacillus thalictri]TBL73278.1 GntR family transcriptional regulator [Paenibacillus thalictri]
MSSHISKSNPMPMYLQIAKDLRERIATGEFPVDAQIPTEEEITTHYGVSRMTARHSVTQLVNEGLVYRVHGKGVFVSKTKLERNLNKLNGFHEDMLELGLAPHSKLVRLEQRLPDQREQHVLQLLKSQAVFEVQRIRYVNGATMGFQKLVTPVHLVPQLENVDLENGSFYSYLKQIGKPLSRAEQRMEAVTAPEVAKLLEVPEHLPFFFFERISFDGSNIPVELLMSYFRGDQYSYSISLG